MDRRWLVRVAAVFMLVGATVMVWLVEINWASRYDVCQLQLQLHEQQQAQLQQMEESLKWLESQERRVAQLLVKQQDSFLSSLPRTQQQPDRNDHNNSTSSSTSSSSTALAQAESLLELIDESPETQWLYVKQDSKRKPERVSLSELVPHLTRSNGAKQGEPKQGARRPKPATTTSTTNTTTPTSSSSTLNTTTDSKRLLVVFPFFNGSAQRWPQASFTIPYYHRYLSLFKIEHEIVLVEQAQTGFLFNRGTLFNVAFQEYMAAFDYMVIADIDSVPIFHRSEKGNTYKWVPFDYPSNGAPYHLAREVGKEGWRFLPWFAGVAMLFRREDYEEVNGFSNNYYGWGNEDDDVHVRINNKFGQIRRYGEHEGMFHSQPHPIVHKKCETNNSLRNRAWYADLCEGRHKMEDDGLQQVKYDIVHRGWTSKWGGFHWLKVIPKTPLMGKQVHQVPQEEVEACKAEAAKPKPKKSPKVHVLLPPKKGWGQ